MKYAFLMLVVLACGLIYLRVQQPKIWNQGVEALKVPEPAPAVTKAAPPVAPPAAPTNTPPQPPPKQVTDEIITPDSQLMNTDHIKQVDQPAQPTDSTGNPAPAAAATNSPAAAPHP